LRRGWTCGAASTGTGAGQPVPAGLSTHNRAIAGRALARQPCEKNEYRQSVISPLSSFSASTRTKPRVGRGPSGRSRLGSGRDLPRVSPPQRAGGAEAARSWALPSWGYVATRNKSRCTVATHLATARPLLGQHLRGRGRSPLFRGLLTMPPPFPAVVFSPKHPRQLFVAASIGNTRIWNRPSGAKCRKKQQSKCRWVRSGPI
jgi:hypothetical protein